MDFVLSKEHEMARTLFRDFAQAEVKPLAQEVDETEHFPWDTVRKMQKLCLLYTSLEGVQVIYIRRTGGV